MKKFEEENQQVEENYIQQQQKMVERAKLEKNIKNITASKERTRVPTEKRGTEGRKLIRKMCKTRLRGIWNTEKELEKWRQRTKEQFRRQRGGEDMMSWMMSMASKL